MACRIESGTVSINSTHSISIQTPFGGVKQSGYGRECGIEALKGYVNIKTIHVNLNVGKK